jgi:lysophospholipase L1-like esterase
MTPYRKLIRLAAVTLLLSCVSAAPLLAQRGNANFTRFVALGDSLSAGYASDSLLFTHQQFSPAAIIARQAGANDFQIPAISEPGIPAELVLTSLVPVTIVRKSNQNGVPTNLQLPRPYNNLSIPGARVNNLLTNTGAETSTNPFYQIILRGLGTSVQQALVQQPTFISVWIGNNDVLGAVIAGTPLALTPIDAFTRDYNLLLDALVQGAPNAGIITANVPDVTSIPYISTVPPFLVNPQTSQPVLGPDGRPIFLVGELGDGRVGILPQGTLIATPASSLIATGFGIPEPLRPNFPNLPNVGRPLPDQVVLTPNEITPIRERQQQVNAAIEAAAAARNIPVVDIETIFQEYRAGRNFAGVVLNTAFLTGGLFSYDGIHPTDLGYTLVANEFIDVINQSWGTRIRRASILPFFANNAPTNASGIVDPVSAQYKFDPAFTENLENILELRKETAVPVVIRSRSRN